MPAGCENQFVNIATLQRPRRKKEFFFSKEKYKGFWRGADLGGVEQNSIDNYKVRDRDRDGGFGFAEWGFNVKGCG